MTEKLLNRKEMSNTWKINKDHRSMDCKDGRTVPINRPTANYIQALETEVERMREENEERMNIIMSFWKFKTYKQWLKMRKEIKEKLWDKI